MRTPHELSRRQFLAGSTAVLGLGVGRLVPFARAAPAATVSVAKCDTYGAELVPTLDRMFDQLGGLGRLVKGRTVAVKLNLTGPPTIRLGPRPAGLAHWVHPRMIGAVVHLMDRAGAHRIRLLEGGYATAIPLDEYMYQAGWDAAEIVGAGRRVELENTNWLGRGKDYPRFDVPGGGLLFPSYLLNHSYRDCDTFVSLTKLKDHTTAGVTLSMKNCFGNIPTTIYGDRVPKDRPDELPHSGRDVVFHDGTRQPSSPAAPEVDPASPRHDGYRIPRVVVDICAARPDRPRDHRRDRVDGGRRGTVGRRRGLPPGSAGRRHELRQHRRRGHRGDGLRPDGPRGSRLLSTPATTSSSWRKRVGLGSRDLGRIEVAGTPIREARFDFAPLVRSRFPRHIPPYPGEKRGS